MNSTRKSVKSISGFLALVAVLAAPLATAQQAAPANQQAAAAKFLGAITSINSDTLTVKTAQGDSRQVQVPANAILKRVEPGQTNLSAAVDMQYTDLAVGDRVLVNLDPSSTAAVPAALRSKRPTFRRSSRKRLKSGNGEWAAW
jgi:predicted outer membrane protein